MRIHPTAKVGRYTGKHKEHHLDRFGSDHFDYIVVDEFHHASARAYQQLLSHFTPRYLLGLTATPDYSGLRRCEDKG